MAQIILDNVERTYSGGIKAVDRHADPLELAVDTRYLQFFDPGSGLSIGHPQPTWAAE